MNVSFQGSPYEQFETKQTQAAPQETAPRLLDEDVKLQEQPSSDVFKTTKKGKTKVNPLRIWFSRLTPEQIDEINTTRRTPDNMKIRPAVVGTGYTINHNIFGLTNGTKTLPEGYELRQNRLGFTRLVPKDTEGFWLKKKPEA